MKDEMAYKRGDITLKTKEKRFEKKKRQYGSCAMCNGFGTLRCSKCKQVHYCGRECQQNHWKKHKTQCAGCERKPKHLK